MDAGTTARDMPDEDPISSLNGRPGSWDDDVILSSLRAPERDRRLQQINKQCGDTFNWAYDDTSVGLSKWL